MGISMIVDPIVRADVKLWLVRPVFGNEDNPMIVVQTQGDEITSVAILAQDVVAQAAPVRTFGPGVRSSADSSAPTQAPCVISFPSVRQRHGGHRQNPHPFETSATHGH